MKASCALVLALGFSILGLKPAYGQLAERNRLGIRMGHMHLMVRDADAHRQFWTTHMGGRIVRNGALELIEFPGVYVVLTEADDPAPPGGSIVDHFGFIVKDMPAALAAWQEAGLEIDPTQNPNEVYVYAPDRVRVEVYGEPSLPTSVSMNHIHYYLPDIPQIKRWYTDVFGANPGRRPCVACIDSPRMIQSADLPAVNLSFSGSESARLPTRGRAIDHVGFDVANLDAFVALLEAQGVALDGPVEQLPGTAIRAVFLTDPWGTRIEVTEGLAPQ
jgi:catechol 2,3-dioxygenase-like lactoylglutathione lyase family enzyme